MDGNEYRRISVGFSKGEEIFIRAIYDQDGADKTQRRTPEYRIGRHVILVK